jgi:hypothetical protein
MLTTAILNGILALGVIVMVVIPLVWAILTQHRDHPRPAAAEGPNERAPLSGDRRRAPRPQYKPAIRHA